MSVLRDCFCTCFVGRSEVVLYSLNDVGFDILLLLQSDSCAGCELTIFVVGQALRGIVRFDFCLDFSGHPEAHWHAEKSHQIHAPLNHVQFIQIIFVA